MIRRLQEAQLSVQALTRLSSAGVFLLASWLDTRHLALVASLAKGEARAWPVW